MNVISQPVPTYILGNLQTNQLLLVFRKFEVIRYGSHMLQNGPT